MLQDLFYFVKVMNKEHFLILHCKRLVWFPMLCKTLVKIVWINYFRLHLVLTFFVVDPLRLHLAWTVVEMKENHDKYEPMQRHQSWHFMNKISDIHVDQKTNMNVLS